MRKLFWAVFIVLVFALGGCDAFAPPGNFEYDPDDVTYTNVVYSPDGSSVTIYLEGGVEVPNRQRRALSKELAIAGHDFFEVAFYYQDGANPGGANDVVARASWELMKDAQIRNVKGKGAGDDDVIYGSNTLWNVYTVNEVIGQTDDEPPVDIYGDVEYTTAKLAPKSGAAILFVGRKTDKTLLGVGELTHVNGALGKTITPATTSVTFTVAAIECGLSPTAGLNSFWTNFHGNYVDPTNTERNEIQMGDYHYYMYELRDSTEDGNSVTSSEYTLRTSANSFDYYRLGIILAGPGAYEKRQPRYPTPDGQFQYFSVMLDDQTIITSGSNTATNVGKPFINPIEITFNTTYTTSGSIFALAFQIPVCPLYLDEEAGTWYIRASYDSYWLDLDDAGLDGRPRGSGGAIMFRTGKISGISNYRIRVVAPPTKYLYSYNNTGVAPNPSYAGVPNTPRDMNPVNRFFNVDGLVVVLEYVHNGEFIRYLDNNVLSFEIGMKAIRARVGNTPGDYLPNTVYGLQTVKVIYVEGGIPHESSFLIIVDNPAREFTGIPANGNLNSPSSSPALPPDQNNSVPPTNAGYLPGSGIPMRNFIVINQAMRDSGNLQDYLSTRFNYGGKTVSTFVVIFDGGNSQNFEINYSATSDLQPSVNNTPNLVISVAGRVTTSGGIQPQLNNTVHVGRTSGTLANGVYRSGSTANSFYFGRWPFNDYLYGLIPGSDYHIIGDTTVGRYDYVEQIVLPTSPPNRFVHRTYNFSLDAYGLAANGGVDSPPGAGDPVGGQGSGNKYFLNDLQGGRFYNVKVGEELLLYNKRWLN
jgi:hypothetical protein